MLGSVSIENSGATIVVLGQFTPGIFSADWMHANNLIGQGDREAALNHEFVVSPQASVLRTDWFSMQVLTGRLQVQAEGPISPSFRDLTVGILGLLVETPVDSIGINFHCHYKMSSHEDYHRIGDVLAPKGIWEKLVPEKSSIGMEDLTMLIQPFERTEQAETRDSVRVTVQPSRLINPGVFMSINNHIEIDEKAKKEKLKPAEITQNTLMTDWENLWKKSTDFMDELLARAAK